VPACRLLLASHCVSSRPLRIGSSTQPRLWNRPALPLSLLRMGQVEQSSLVFVTSLFAIAANGILMANSFLSSPEMKSQSLKGMERTRVYSSFSVG